MVDKEDLNPGDKVKHVSRDWYQQCVVIEVEKGCNGGIKVLCQDSPVYDTSDPRCSVKGFTESVSRFCPQDLSKVI